MKTDKRSSGNHFERPPGGATLGVLAPKFAHAPLHWMRLTFCLLLSLEYERRFKLAMQKMTAGTRRDGFSYRFQRYRQTAAAICRAATPALSGRIPLAPLPPPARPGCLEIDSPSGLTAFDQGYAPVLGF
jgi:hypothetical protein